MKFLILLLISFTAQASFLPESKVGKDTTGIKIFSKKSKCEKEYSETCISIRKVENLEIGKIRPEKWLKDLAQECTDDCQEKLEALECSDSEWLAVKTESEVYCTKFRPKSIVVDSDKKAIRDAAKAVKAQEKADQKAEVQEIKGYIQNVNDSELPNWHKKILKKLIRDMKED